MTRFVFCLLAALALRSICNAEVTKLPAETRKILEDSSRFHQIGALTNLPATVIALCADRNGRLAEPGGKWEEGDYIRDKSLPRKRLIWAVTDGEYYVVHYEKGGLAYSCHFLVVAPEPSENKPRTIWRGTGPKVKNLESFIEALKKNKLDDRSDYY